MLDPNAVCEQAGCFSNWLVNTACDSQTFPSCVLLVHSDCIFYGKNNGHLLTVCDARSRHFTQCMARAVMHVGVVLKTQAALQDAALTWSCVCWMMVQHVLPAELAVVLKPPTGTKPKAATAGEARCSPAIRLHALLAPTGSRHLSSSNSFKISHCARHCRVCLALMQIRKSNRELLQAMTVVASGTQHDTVAVWSAIE